MRQPRRVGKPLGGKEAGRWRARRGPYRLIYEIDEKNEIVRVLHAAHSADVYCHEVRPGCGPTPQTVPTLPRCALC